MKTDEPADCFALPPELNAPQLIVPIGYGYANANQSTISCKLSIRKSGAGAPQATGIEVSLTVPDSGKILLLSVVITNARAARLLGRVLLDWAAELEIGGRV